MHTTMELTKLTLGGLTSNFGIVRHRRRPTIKYF